VRGPRRLHWFRPSAAVFVFGMFVASVSGATAAVADTWHWVGVPNVSDHPDSDLTQGHSPPVISWPGEGTSSTGDVDPVCAATAPYRNGRRARTGFPNPMNMLTGVRGIWKRGGFVRVGNPTVGAEHGANHLAVFFHTPDLDGLPCYRGGTEYGFLRNLADGSTNAGDQPLDFYQCENCNCKPDCAAMGPDTVTERYTSKATGWDDAQQDRIYRVSFLDFAKSSFGVTCASSRDNFFIEVLQPESASPKLLYSVKICRASWMSDLRGGSGWITANAHADKTTSDGVDRFDGSFNQVTTVKWLSA
jgi:hypothetical protein